MTARSRRPGLLCALALAAAGCSDETAETGPPRPESLSPTARVEVHESLIEALDEPKHPADGAGRAWLVEDESTVPAVVSTPGTWTIVYEAGPQGVAVGGSVRLRVPVFWEWSEPQVVSPNYYGYCVVESEAQGVRLDPFASGNDLVCDVRGRALREGERIRIVYGASPRGARPDPYAERRSLFELWVDGDGDGYASRIEDPPWVDVLPAPAARLVVTVPSTPAPGEEFPLTVALLDHRGNAGCEFQGSVELVGPEGAFELPESIRLEPLDRGRKTVTARAVAEGLFRLAAVALEDGENGRSFEAISDPVLVDDLPTLVLWGDLHGHTSLTDGTGTVEDYFTYARDVAGLDVVALTDHDHWGNFPLDERPDLWRTIVDETRRFHEPGRFVTLLGYEWTSWLHGHRHVLYFEDAGEVYSSIAPETTSPEGLWDALRGRPALTFAHHSAGGPVATNWEIAPDPEFEPVTEIISVHGSSEAVDSPQLIYDPQKGNFVRDILEEKGYRLGFIGSGDGHDGHPGLTRFAYPSSGLAAILATERTRESVLEALRARRVYATNGVRALLRTSLAGHRMGADVPAPAKGESLALAVWVIGTGPLRHMDLIRRGRPVATVSCGGAYEFSETFQLEGLVPGDFVYVRAIQEDGGAVWSSPFYVTEAE